MSIVLIVFILSLRLSESVDFQTGVFQSKTSGIFDLDVLRKTEPATENHYGGMNRIVLEKNIVNGINLLTQAMLNQENAIYEISYDFDDNSKKLIDYFISICK